MKKKELYRVHEDAKKISKSEAWKLLLTTMDKRVRFEDGYVCGWFAHKKYIQQQKRRLKTTGKEK